jgi:hypothetical protein
MVKVTGGGRGMRAIAAHFKYISKNGRLDIEDDHGEVLRGKGDLRGLADDWRLGGTPIDEIGFRREAFNIMLSMPRGVDPLYVLKAAREFAQAELGAHKYVMVLHGHQANPHVHISVRAESKHGKRLNPRKADLHRWRETFAEKLRGHGVEAEATRQTTRGKIHRYSALWQVKAAEKGRLLKVPVATRRGAGARASCDAAQVAWRELAAALAATGSKADRQLSRSIETFVGGVSQWPAPESTREQGRSTAR